MVTQSQHLDSASNDIELQRCERKRRKIQQPKRTRSRTANSQELLTQALK
jgi:hypothetical protein